MGSLVTGQSRFPGVDASNVRKPGDFDCPSVLFAPPFHTFSHTFVSIRAGPDRVPFHVHKGLVCFYSAYFSRAYNGDFIEAPQGCVELPHADPEVVSRFVSWLYVRKFADDVPKMKSWITITIGSIKEVCTREDAPEEFEEFEMFCKLYVFGDAHECRELRNMAITALVQTIQDKKRVFVDVVPWIKENTPEKSWLWRLMVDVMATYVAPEALRKHVEILPDGFLVEVLKAKDDFYMCCRRKVEGVGQTVASKVCRWHEH